MSKEPAPATADTDDIGLSIDRLDADRLLQWAQNIHEYGPDISHWGSVSFVSEKLRELAHNLTQAVRDIGTLRAARAAVEAQHQQELGAAMEKFNALIREINRLETQLAAKDAEIAHKDLQIDNLMDAMAGRG